MPDDDPTIPVSLTTPVCNPMATSPATNRARRDRVRRSVAQPEFVIGRLQRAVLWHLDASPGTRASWLELKRIIQKASYKNDISSSSYGTSVPRRVLDGMLKQSMVDYLAPVKGEFNPQIRYTIGTRGQAALRHLHSRGENNPHLEGKHND